jgi:DNA polymerase-3 subunit gamma/tau
VGLQITYKALARSWRPSKFDEIIGQETVCVSLKNALISGRVHHAWLFSGTRGVGKTTIARILAKALNCEQGWANAPCLQCDNCQSFSEGSFMDVIEIDAASRTKVEDTRELLENVQYLPSKGQYKIYIIDEVHMLSTHSFNALLKTLEEPPPHVKFILATTNPDKLPVTILSRCIRFHLRNLLPDEIAKQMAKILDKEQVSYEQESLLALAKSANGSMRDGLSLLDGAIALGNGSVSQDVVRQMIGMVDFGNLSELLSAVFRKDRQQTLALSQQIRSQGVDLSVLIDEILSVFHQLAILKVSGDVGCDLTGEDEQLLALNELVNAEDLQLFYQMALKSKEELSIISQPFIAFEMLLIRMLVFSLGDATVSEASLPKQELKASQDLPKNTVIEPKMVTSAQEIPTLTPKTVQSAVTVADTPQADQETVKPMAENPKAAEKSSTMAAETPSRENWGRLVPSFRLGGLAQTVLNQSEFIELSANGVLTLKLEEGHRSIVNDIVLDRITSCLERAFSQKIKLDINYSSDVLKSPFREKQAQEKAQLQNAKDGLLADSTLNQMVKQCQGEILSETIKPEKTEL